MDMSPENELLQEHQHSRTKEILFEVSNAKKKQQACGLVILH
jgi:hypothetical protein